MEKTRYNIVLRDGCDQNHFLTEGDGKGLEVVDGLSEIKGLILLNLTHNEAIRLADSDDIVAIEIDLPVVASSLYPPTTPLKSLTVDLVADLNYPFPYTEFVGKFASHFFHYMSDIPLRGAGNTAPLGYFASEDSRSTNEVVTQNYAGHYVDIVAVEAGTPDSGLDGYENHPDWDDEAGDATRFVKMDWNTYAGGPGGISANSNIQATNNTEYLDDHAIGVLSVAGGKYCGWAKVSSLRVIYINVDSNAAVYNAILAWHNSKPINPVTGKKNATIVNNSWASTQAFSAAIPVDAISSIQAYDTANNAVTISRPGSSWGTDLTPFYNNSIMPRILRDPETNIYGWYITRDPYQVTSSTFSSILTAFNEAGGIYFVKSAGNNTAVGVKANDPRWNTRCFTSGSFSYLVLGNSGGTVTITKNPNGSSNVPNFYPLRVFYESVPDMFNIGAMQHSTANPLPDAYSARGPMIDVFGAGAYTWAAVPQQVYSGGPVAPPGWPGGWFSGTSCASPVIAGMAALMIDHFFVQRGVYPTVAQLKNLVISNAVSRVQSQSLANETFYSNSPPFSYTDAAATVRSRTPSRLRFNTTEPYAILSGFFWNGGLSLPDLGTTPPRQGFIPYKIRLGNGKYISDVRGPAYGSRPTNGQTYPRRKIKIGPN